MAIDKTKLKTPEELAIKEKSTITLFSANADIEANSDDMVQAFSLAENPGDNENNDPLESIKPTYPIDKLEPVHSKELGMMQERFAMTPLYTKYYEYALQTEYMIDEYSGSSSVKLMDGRIVMDQEEGRLRYHLMLYEQELSYYGMRTAIIKKAIYDNDSYIHPATSGKNILDSPIYIDDQKIIRKMSVSLDVDILDGVDYSPILHTINIDPNIMVKYTADMGGKGQYVCKLSQLRMTIETMDTISLTIEEIVILTDEEHMLERCLILPHSILIGLVEDV